VRRDLALGELDDLLQQPLVSVLATYRRDGGVLLSPVWHRWRDGGFDVTSSPTDVKVRHLRRDPRASLLIYDQHPPYRGVEIRTMATLSELTDADALREIAVHYLGKDAGEAYAAAAGSAVVTLIRLEPGHVRAWDFADEL
jgi:PPOX class probable F420-dependent enzyme